MFNNTNIRKVVYLKRIGDYLNALSEIEKLLVEYESNNWLIRQAAYLYYYFQKWDEIEKLKKLVNVNDSTAIGLIEELNLLTPVVIDFKGKSDHIIKEVNFVPQVGNGCVPASCAMILNYWENSETKGRDISKKLQCELRDNGTSIYNIAPFLMSKNYQVFPFSDKNNIVIELLDKGFPILCIQKSSVESLEEHARVIVGYDLKKSLFYILDPSQGKSFIPFKIYEKLGNDRGKNMHILTYPSHINISSYIENHFEYDEIYYNFMGCAYDDLGMINKSEDCFIKGMDIEPNYDELLNNYANLLLKCDGRLNEAYYLCKKAIECCGDITEYSETLRCIEEKGGAMILDDCR